MLQLPDGFRYISYGWTGDIMSDAVRTPSLHDGMAVVKSLGRGEPLPGPTFDGDPFYAQHLSWWNDWVEQPVQGEAPNRVILVRNHEPGGGAPYVDSPSITYRQTGAGGTTNLVFDTANGRWEHAWCTLAGTIRNCAGGVTPWGTWITGEETVDAGHGWSFDVGAYKGDPTPCIDMGRFSHEACMVDPETGFVFQTEDSGNCGLYLFVPRVPSELARGGKLYMLKVPDNWQANLGYGLPIGTTWDVEWVRIKDPAATSESCFTQGFNKGGARFSRLEGAWWGEGALAGKGYFLSTDGGQAGEGQVFEIDYANAKLKLIYDSPGADELDNPDNMVVTPRGGLLLCEDAAGNQFTEGERLIGLNLNGETFTFAQNNIQLALSPNGVIQPGDYRQNEWAGACYSPDGKWLFVNIQTPGITFAITGPFDKGPV